MPQSEIDIPQTLNDADQAQRDIIDAEDFETAREAVERFKSKYIDLLDEDTNEPLTEDPRMKGFDDFFFTIDEYEGVLERDYVASNISESKKESEKDFNAKAKMPKNKMTRLENVCFVLGVASRPIKRQLEALWADSEIEKLATDELKLAIRNIRVLTFAKAKLTTEIDPEEVETYGHPKHLHAFVPDAVKTSFWGDLMNDPELLSFVVQKIFDNYHRQTHENLGYFGQSGPGFYGRPEEYAFKRIMEAMNAINIMRRCLLFMQDPQREENLRAQEEEVTKTIKDVLMPMSEVLKEIMEKVLQKKEKKDTEPYEKFTAKKGSHWRLDFRGTRYWINLIKSKKATLAESNPEITEIITSLEELLAKFELEK